MENDIDKLGLCQFAFCTARDVEQAGDGKYYCATHWNQLEENATLYERLIDLQGVDHKAETAKLVQGLFAAMRTEQPRGRYASALQIIEARANSRNQQSQRQVRALICLIFLADVPKQWWAELYDLCADGAPDLEELLKRALRMNRLIAEVRTWQHQTTTGKVRRANARV